MDINKIFYELDDLKELFGITIEYGGPGRDPKLVGKRSVSIAHLERKRMISVAIVCEVTRDSTHRVLFNNLSKTYIPLSHLVELIGDNPGRVFELAKVSRCIALFPIESGLTLCDVLIPLDTIREIWKYMIDI